MENRIIQYTYRQDEDGMHLIVITANGITHDLGIVNPNAMTYDYIGFTLGTCVDLLGIALSSKRITVTSV